LEADAVSELASAPSFAPEAVAEPEPDSEPAGVGLAVVSDVEAVSTLSPELAPELAPEPDWALPELRPSSKPWMKYSSPGISAASIEFK
jgi:hypothetical protein